MTTTNSWLPLAEYSMKHHVSISTLRRRIKTEDIKFRFDDGKYFIFDEEPKKQAQTETYRPSLKRENFGTLSKRIDKTKENLESSGPLQENELQGLSNIQADTGESVLTAANKLLTDLKKAYTQVLHEKEEQIMNLKEEVVDLKTLIKVLESENNRLRERL